MSRAERSVARGERREKRGERRGERREEGGGRREERGEEKGEGREERGERGDGEMGESKSVSVDESQLRNMLAGRSGRATAGFALRPSPRAQVRGRAIAREVSRVSGRPRVWHLQRGASRVDLVPLLGKGANSKPWQRPRVMVRANILGARPVDTAPVGLAKFALSAEEWCHTVPTGGREAAQASPTQQRPPKGCQNAMLTSPPACKRFT